MRANGVRLQRRHFCWLAAIIAEEKDPELRRKQAETFANHLAGTNPMFKRERFIEACKVEEDR